jgi:uncharacterized membrane protein YeaQ/YmgE (transglycosylase-associated protein family)
MNIALWMLAGGILGWLGFARLGYNEGRTLMVSVIIGVAGGFIGGHVIAPIFSAAAAVPGDFRLSALMFAAAIAAAFLFASSRIHDRWGI